MKKSTKVMLIITACVFGLGLVLMAIGGFAGGRMINSQFRGWGGNVLHTVLSDNYFNGTPKTIDTVPTKDITELTLNCGGVDVTVVQGDTYSLQASNNIQVISKVSDNDWYIEADARKYIHVSKTQLVVTIPSNVNLQEIEVELGAGRLQIENMQVQTLDISSGAGDIGLNNVVVKKGGTWQIAAGNMEVNNSELTGEYLIDCGAGRVYIETKEPKDWGWDIDVGVGNVRIGQTKYSGLGNSSKHNVSADTVFTIDCAVGDVSIVFE